MKKREIHQVINIDNLPEDIREHLIKEFDLNPQECNLILIVGDEKRISHMYLPSKKDASKLC